MTKVEELREALIGVYSEDADASWMRTRLDSLIAAAREEGAEQERERIVRLSDICKEGDRLDSGTGSYFLANTMVATANVFIIPDFLLSPATKEADNGKD